jgi:hypothetical protein
MALGLIQLLTEMCPTNLPGGKGQPAHKADNLTTICELTVLKMWEASTSHNPMGLYSPLRFTSIDLVTNSLIIFENILYHHSCTLKTCVGKQYIIGEI